MAEDSINSASLRELGKPSSALQASGSQAFRPKLESSPPALQLSGLQTIHRFPWVSSLFRADHGSSSVSTTIWAKCLTIFLFIRMYMCIHIHSHTHIYIHTFRKIKFGSVYVEKLWIIHSRNKPFNSDKYELSFCYWPLWEILAMCL